ncbi:hypothetical protein MRB53_001672 [Persea americana]|uniref:Uncharacterized protein n=1 Tax=Persea americana TaxID=3435 RepID=A0ACC2MSI9_PERAE|nr:hypothetical protein MRB53_001672 [Persea americana]
MTFGGGKTQRSI